MLLSRHPLALTALLAVLTVTPKVSLAKESTEPAAAPRLQCFSAPAAVSKLPKTMPVGIETIHRDSEKIITIYVPMAPAEQPSKMLDTNAKIPSQRLPDRFVISDGSVRTAFVGIDRSAGGRLDLCLAEILRKIPSSKPEAVYAFIKNHLQDSFLKEPPKQFAFAWDRGRKEAPELLEFFHAAKDLPVGHYPLRSKQTQDVVPLEDFIEVGYGTCLHKALLASLLLAKLGIPHRMVNGATHITGHTWIELDDGRILDPSLKELAHPEPSKALPGWIKYGSQFAFENQVWPFLSLD